jgi:hypothetical protein
MQKTPISSFRLSGSYLLAAGSANGNVPPVETPQPVPEPLGAIGTLVGVVTAMRLRKKWIGIGKNSAIPGDSTDVQIATCKQNCKQIFAVSNQFYLVDTVNRDSDCETDIYCTSSNVAIAEGLLMQVLDSQSGDNIDNIDDEFCNNVITEYPFYERLLTDAEINQAAASLDLLAGFSAAVTARGGY